MGVWPAPSERDPPTHPSKNRQKSTDPPPRTPLLPPNPPGGEHPSSNSALSPAGVLMGSHRHLNPTGCCPAFPIRLPPAQAEQDPAREAGGYGQRSLSCLILQTLGQAGKGLHIGRGGAGRSWTGELRAQVREAKVGRIMSNISQGLTGPSGGGGAAAPPRGPPSDVPTGKSGQSPVSPGPRGLGQMGF